MHVQGGGLRHSSTFQLTVTTICGLHASTSRLDVSTPGLSWEVSWTKTSQAELKSGRWLKLQLQKIAHAELRSGRV